MPSASPLEIVTFAQPIGGWKSFVVVTQVPETADLYSVLRTRQHDPHMVYACGLMPTSDTPDHAPSNYNPHFTGFGWRLLLRLVQPDIDKPLPDFVRYWGHQIDVYAGGFGAWGAYLDDVLDYIVSAYYDETVHRGAHEDTTRVKIRHQPGRTATQSMPTLGLLERVRA